MLASHYAPRKPLFFLEPGEERARRSITSASTAGILLFDDAARERWQGAVRTGDVVAVLSPSGDLHEAARRLFGTLRGLDDDPRTQILVAEGLTAESGLAYAINDRLRRAGRARP
jgi:L-threonylcarbamoyladenylate synthase